MSLKKLYADGFQLAMIIYDLIIKFLIKIMGKGRERSMSGNGTGKGGKYSGKRIGKKRERKRGGIGNRGRKVENDRREKKSSESPLILYK